MVWSIGGMMPISRCGRPLEVVDEIQGIKVLARVWPNHLCPLGQSILGSIVFGTLRDGGKMLSLECVPSPLHVVRPNQVGSQGLTDPWWSLLEPILGGLAHHGLIALGLPASLWFGSSWNRFGLFILYVCSGDCLEIEFESFFIVCTHISCVLF